MSEGNTEVFEPLRGRPMDLADYQMARYGVRVPAGTKLQDLLHPSYFQNYLHLIGRRPGTVVEVLSDDNALDATLRVLTVTKTTARMRVLRNHEEPSGSAGRDIGSEMEVTWGGPQHKWRFLHRGEIIEKGFGSEAEAREAAARYAETVKG